MKHEIEDAQAVRLRVETALEALSHFEEMDSNTRQAGRALREALALIEPYARVWPSEEAAS